MHDNPIIGLFISIAIIIVVFFILRGVNLWYWKINQRISAQNKTNYLLEMILIKLGSTNIDEIEIEEIATGKKKKVKVDDWVEFKTKNSNSNGFRVTKE